MVGGIIIGIVVTNDEALVHVQGAGCEKNDTIACRCKHFNKPLAIGDSFWWQCGKCYWTPQNSSRKKCGVDFDIPLPKVGYSHSHGHV